MPTTRLRMRPWLEKQIESRTIPGLSWLNKVLNLLLCGKLQVFHVNMHINCGLLIPAGGDDLPDPMEACCTAWLGHGQRCFSFPQLGYSHR